jgi:hypothetical protein
LFDSDDDGLPDERDSCPTDARNRCADESTWPKRPNSTALMVAGFVTMGMGGTVASFATLAANFCMYCNKGASDAQKEQFYPYAIVGAIVVTVGIPLAMAGAYPVTDRRALKDRGGLTAPTLLLGSRAAMVRWVF